MFGVQDCGPKRVWHRQPQLDAPLVVDFVLISCSEAVAAVAAGRRAAAGRDLAGAMECHRFL